MIFSVSRPQLGYIGERLVLYELALRNIRATKLPNFFDYDLITENGVKIEVKTAQLQKKIHKNKRVENHVMEAWTFSNHKTTYKTMKIVNGEKLASYNLEKRDRHCDFYTFVCWSNQGCITYVVPNSEIRDKKGICIYSNGNSRLQEYRERWELIARFKGVGKLPIPLNSTDMGLESAEFA